MNRHAFQSGFSGLLALIFITLKLTNVINWSWWWVFYSIWIGIFVLAAIIAGVVAILYFRDKKK